MPNGAKVVFKEETYANVEIDVLDEFGKIFYSNNI